MNTQPTRAQQQQEEDPPFRWNTRWYRFRLKLYRLAARLLGMPRPYNVNRALKNERWKGFQDAKEHYLGHCPKHPEELMLETGRGFRKCCSCWDEAYFQMHDSGPITDPRHLQVRPLSIPTMRPVEAYNQLRDLGAGPHTAAISAIPKRTGHLDTPDQERRQA